MHTTRQNTVYMLDQEIVIRHDLYFRVTDGNHAESGSLQRRSAVTVLQPLGDTKVRIRTSVASCMLDGSVGTAANQSRMGLHRRLLHRAADRAEYRLMQVIDVVVDLTLFLPILITYLYVIDGEVDLQHVQAFLIAFVARSYSESLRSE